MRKRMTKLEVLEKIIAERQPITVSYVRQFATSYVEWKGSRKEDMYDFIRKHFDVGHRNMTTIKSGKK